MCSAAAAPPTLPPAQLHLRPFFPQAIPDEIEATDYRGGDDDAHSDPALDALLAPMLLSAPPSAGAAGMWAATLQMEVRGSRLALPDDLSFRAAAFEPEPAETYAGDAPPHGRCRRRTAAAAARVDPSRAALPASPAPRVRHRPINFPRVHRPRRRLASGGPNQPAPFP